MSKYRIKYTEYGAGWGSKDFYSSESTFFVVLVQKYNECNLRIDLLNTPDYNIIANEIQKKDEESGVWFKVYPKGE